MPLTDHKCIANVRKEKIHRHQRDRIRKFVRGLSRKQQHQKIGEDRLQKVSLLNVKNVMQSTKCTRKCLTKVQDMKIMRLRYRVWINSKMYEEKVIWIFIGMNSCK